MFIGIGNPIPELSNLPGVSRPGAGPSGPSVDQIANQYSFEFDGANSYFDLGSGLGDSLGSSYNGPISISTWIKTTNFTKPGGSGIFQLGNLSGYGYISAVLASSKLNIYTNSGATQSSATAARSSDISSAWSNNWINIVVVWDTGDSANSKVYAQGSPLTLPTNDWASVSGSSVINFTGVNSFIGLYYNNSYTFDGKIDEVAFFNRELDDKDVKAIYDATTSGMTADLSTLSTGTPYAWYRMGD